MKKIITLTMALLLSTAAFAQFSSQIEDPTGPQSQPLNDPIPQNTNGPVWEHIGTPFTATDINGVTVSIADTLAAGKAVLINYFCTWDPYSYQLHTSGKFLAIHNQLHSNVCVLWVEADSYTTVADIRGTGNNTWGDWTHYYNSNGQVTGTVPYRIIDCVSCSSMVSDYGYVPDICFIAPNGYYTRIYNESWGITLSMTSAQAVSNVQNLLTLAPHSGQAPLVYISGSTFGIVNHMSTYTANVVSVDSIVSAVWSVTGGTPATSTNDTFNVTWTTAGNQQVIHTVTNTSGSTSDTFTVSVYDWNWGDTISYCVDTAYTNSIGVYPEETKWGIKIPAQHMSGRNYFTGASLYVPNPGFYEMNIYQGGDTVPQTLIYNNVYYFADYGTWKTCPAYSHVTLNPTQNLWVTFRCVETYYPAAYSTFCGDSNSNLIYYDSVWQSLDRVAPSYFVSWMIKATTSATMPTLPPIPPIQIPAPTITGRSVATIGDTVIFSISNASSFLTYNWTFPGGIPVTSTSDTASATWSTPGIYNVICTATLGTNHASDTFQISVVDCTVSTFPDTMGFEATDPTIICWTSVNVGSGSIWDYTNNISGHTRVASSVTRSNYDSVDCWLISPLLDFTNVAEITISWSHYSSYADHYLMYLSTTGNSISDFLQSDYAFRVTPSGNNYWQTVGLNLNNSGFAGQQVYIAFRHNCHPSSNHTAGYLYLDDITVTATPATRKVNSFTCTGTRTGAIYKGAYSGTSLCGMSDTVWSTENITYNFIPDSPRSILSALYVNGIDRIAYVTTRTVNSRRVYSLIISDTVNCTVQAVFAPQMFPVTVVSADSTMGIASGGGTFASDSTITLTATPMPHYHFTSWTIVDAQGTHTATENPLSYTVESEATVTANFEVDVYTITVVPNDVTYGIVTGGGTFTYLDVVTLSATAFSGYHFSHWSNGATYNPYIFPATENLDLTAIFISDDDTTSQFATITVRAYDPTMGTVEGGGVFLRGSTATISAMPNEGYRFVQWQDANSENPRTITVVADAEYIAYFEANVGIDNTDGDVCVSRVYAEGRQIVVTGAEGDDVYLYDMMGRRLASRQGEDVHRGTPLRFDVPASGVYLVRIGDRAARKVVVVR